MPLADEGKARMVIAREALKAIRKECPATVIYNEQIPNKDQSVKAAWQEINRSCIIQMMLVLQEIIQVVGDVINLDMNDLKQMLSAGNRVQFGFSPHEDENEAEVVAKTLLSNPYQDTSIALAAKKFSMWRHGDWNINTFSRMTQEINRMRAKDDGGIDIKCGMVSDIRDRKKWVAMLAVAEDEDREDSTVPAAAVVQDNASAIPTNGKGELVQMQCLVKNVTTHLDVPRDIKRRWDKVCALTPSQENCGEVEKLIDSIATLTNVHPDLPRGFERISR
jgi:cell division GTPase FtsZ